MVTSTTSISATTFIRTSLCLLILAGTLNSTPSASQTFEESELYQAYGSGDFITISTGRLQPLNEAPSIATVITAQDIRAMGATDLDEVLETVPGLHVSRSALAYNPIYMIRGITTDFNPQVLVAINGIPITNSFIGDRNQIWGGMPVEAIARIEVIRGPGSATNGADAFAGVINIITKTAEDIERPEAGIRAGSFNTQQAWTTLSHTWNGWKSALIAEIGTTDGQHERVDADAQTLFDQLTGTTASLAPGGVNTGVDRLDLRLDMAKGDWRIRAGYQGRRDLESGAGLASALDPVGSAESDRWNVDVTYTDIDFAPDWKFTALGHFFSVNAKPDAVLYPPGTDFTLVGGGAFPDGVLAQPDVYERHWRLAFDWLYSGMEHHTVRLGLGAQIDDLYRVEERKNFSQNPAGFPVPLGALVDVSSTAPFTQENQREVYFGLVQDEWKFIPDWTLTTGVRLDHYSDFGETINPRVALVWNALRNMTVKALYGRAFRAPSFAEQFNINNPVALGNPDLDPETIDTLELGIDYSPKADLRTSANIFAYHMRDLISIDPTSRTAHNAGRIDGYGFEWDIRYKVSTKTELRGNYAFQRAEDEATQSSPGIAPEHQAYAAVIWKPIWDLSFMTQLQWIGERERAATDTRPTLDDYAITNFHVQYSATNNLELSASIRNAFDTDAKEPSLNGTLIPYDLPLAGRSFMTELRYYF